jgi:MFS family permease
VLAHSAFNGTRLTISLNALALGGSPLVVGLMMSLFAFLPMVLGVASGRLVDRIGIRLPLLLSVAAVTVSIAVPAALPGMGSLYVAAAGVGTGFMLFHIAVQHAVGEGSAVHERKSNFGWLALAFSTSNFVGPMVSGVAIDAFGHRATFLLLTAFALTALLLLLPRRGRFTHTPDAPARGGTRSAFELLREPELRRVFLVTGLLGSAWDLFVFAIPIYGTAIGLSASTIGLILSAFAAATFIIRMALPWLSRGVREWTMITSTMAVACLAYALFPPGDHGAAARRDRIPARPGAGRNATVRDVAALRQGARRPRRRGRRRARGGPQCEPYGPAARLRRGGRRAWDDAGFLGDGGAARRRGHVVPSAPPGDALAVIFCRTAQSRQVLLLKCDFSLLRSP